MTVTPIRYSLLIAKSKYPIIFVVFNLVLYSINIFTSNYSDFIESANTLQFTMICQEWKIGFQLHFKKRALCQMTVKI